MEDKDTLMRFQNYNFDEDDRFLTGLSSLQFGKSDDEAAIILRAKLFYFNKFIEPISLDSFQNGGVKTGGSLSAVDKSVCDSLQNLEISPPENEQSSNTANEELQTTVSETTVDPIASVNVKGVTNSPEIINESKLSLKDLEEESMDRSLDGHITGPCASQDKDHLDSRVEEAVWETCSKVDKHSVSEKDLQTSAKEMEKEEMQNGISGVSHNVHEESLSFAEIIDYVQKGEPIPGIKELDIQPTNQSPTESCVSRRSKPWENITQS